MHPLFTFLASFNFLSQLFLLQLLLYFYHKKTSPLSVLSKSSWRLVPFCNNKKAAFEIKGCGETDVPCMLSTAWCWTNKAASFFSALHEYWRLQLIKWQHTQLHQAAASASNVLTLLARSKGRAWAPVWCHPSQGLTPCLCCSPC